MTDAASPSVSDRRQTGTLGYLLGAVTALLLLFLLTQAFLEVRCTWLMFVVALVAWPLWRYQVDRRLFERRAILAAVATQTGRLRQWFWRGRVTTVWQVFVALALATMLLALLHALQTVHWGILAADALLLAVVMNPIGRMLSHHVQEGYLGLVTRHWPLMAINVVALTATLVLLDLYTGRPDTRGAEWSLLVEQAFASARAETVCPAAGLVLGVASAGDQLSWHVAMGLLPQLPSLPARIMAWIVFLVWTGFGAFLFTRCMLGVFALLDRSGGAETGKDDRLSRAFLYTILVLAIPYLYASIRYAQWEYALPAPTPVVLESPCEAFEFDTDAVQSAVARDVNRARTEAHAIVEERIDAALDPAFGAATRGVDDYLDWYFSMLGDYSRLAAVVVGDVDQLMTKQLSTHLFEETNVFGILEAASADVELESMRRMEAAAAAAGLRIDRALEASPCPAPNLDPTRLLHLERDRLRASVATAAGGAVTAKFLLKKPAAAAAGKLAGKGIVKAASKVMAKAAAKKGTSALGAAAAGAAVCSPAGPAAIACGIVAGAVVWLTVDKAIIEVDEAVNRDKMRAELLMGLAEQRQEIREELMQLHTGLVDLYAVEIERRASEVFVPARDGM